MNGRRIILLLITALLLFALSGPASASQRKVLLISSYHPGFPTFFQQIDGLKSVLVPQGVSLDVEFMDSKRFFSPDSLARFHELLKSKLEAIEAYDVVITSDDNALNYALKYKHELFPETPVVFCGVNNQDRAYSLSSNVNITGVIESVSIRETVNMIWHLLPEVDTVYAVVDSTPSGQGDLQKYLTMSSSFPGKQLKVLSLADMAWREFGDKLKGLSDNEALLLLSAYRDNAGSEKGFDESLELIMKNAPVPVFHLWQHGLGDGILGGRIISHFEQGKIAGLLAIDIISGKAVKDMPIVAGAMANRFVVDHPVLERFGIPEERLPEKTLVLNRPTSVMSQYKLEITLIIVCVFSLALIATILFIMVIKLRESRAALQESDNKHRVLFEKSPLGMILFDEHGKILDCNENFTLLMGASKEELVGFNTAIDSTPDMRQAIKVALEGTASVYEGEYTSVTGNKTTSLRVVFNPVNAGINPTPVIATLEDVGERKKAEAAIIRATEKLEKANRHKSEFLANMSHEIRTPLNGVLGMLQLVEATSLNEEQNECVDLAIQSTKRLNRLLSDILDITKVEAGKLGLRPKPFDLNETVRQVAELFHITAKHTGVEIDYYVDPGIPKQLLGDAARLQQVLNNLVGNAFKFTSSGSISIEAHPLPVIHSDQHRVLFKVSDTGIGIPEDKISTLFDAFRQASEGYRRQYQGAGLGLSICKHLVSIMGGNIAVDTEVGKGTSINFSIPFASTTQPVEMIGPEDELADCTKGLRILLAEDDRVNRLAVKGLLERLRCEVHAVEDGQKVLAVLAQQGFDMVIMDIQMPVMDGVEATRAIRDGEVGNEKKDIPIIALTAYAMAGDKEKFLDSGMDAYLTKPVDIKNLQAALNNAVQCE